MGRSLISGFLGLLDRKLFKFFLATASDGMPRAVKRAGWSRLPGAPGRLGYLAAERLVELAGFVPASASLIFINIQIFYSRARLTDGSLIEQTAL